MSSTTSTDSRRAYLVLGPESSGTRLVTRILIAGGCHGSDDHVQPFDSEIPADLSPIVWRRSLPHGHDHRWPNVRGMISHLYNLGYIITVVVPTRDLYCTISSQLAWSHVTDKSQAKRNICKAYRDIYEAIWTTDVNYHVSSYEQLVRYPASGQISLLLELGLRLPASFSFVKITDENTKHIGSQIGQSAGNYVDTYVEELAQ